MFSYYHNSKGESISFKVVFCIFGIGGKTLRNKRQAEKGFSLSVQNNNIRRNFFHACKFYHALYSSRFAEFSRILTVSVDRVVKAQMGAAMTIRENLEQLERD